MTDDFDLKASTWDENTARVARAGEVARQITARVAPGDSTHVLDFGSGTGLLGFHFLPSVASVTFADPSPGMLVQVEAKLSAGSITNGRTLRLDPETTAVPGRYDLVVSLMTLHHVPDPPAAIAGLADSLEPGGWLALCDLDLEDGTFHDDPGAKVHHGFDRAALVDLAEKLGLERVEVSTAYVMTLDRGEGTKDYPLFLLVARRPDSTPT